MLFARATLPLGTLAVTASNGSNPRDSRSVFHASCPSFCKLNPVSRLSWRSRFRSLGVTRILTGTISRGGGAILSAGSAGSMDAITSASDLPRLAVISGDLLNPLPGFLEFNKRLAGGVIAYLSDTAALKGCIEIHRAVGYVHRTNRNWVARKRRTCAECAASCLRRVDDQCGRFVEAADNFQGFANSLQVIGGGANRNDDQIGNTCGFSNQLINCRARIDEEQAIGLAPECLNGSCQRCTVEINQVRELRSGVKLASAIPPFGCCLLWIAVDQQTCAVEHCELARQRALAGAALLTDE